MSDLQVRVISIHALREEGDRYNNRMPRRAGDFYPRPPRGGRRFLLFFFGEFIEISIHALREEGDPVGKLAALLAGISIHALREEGDAHQWALDLEAEISIHALREEGDEPPGRPYRPGRDFYPRPPRGGRPMTPQTVAG